MNQPSLPLQLALIGATGRMGTAILKALLSQTNISLAGAIAHPKSTKLGLNVWSFLAKNNVDECPPPLPIQGSLHDLDPQQFDMVLDVSLPSTTEDHINYCCQHKKKLLLGTTGLSQNMDKQLKQASVAIPLLYAPNFSLGMAFLEHALRQALPWSAYDVHILETHHKHKKDAPSGSALRLQEAIESKNTPVSMQIDSVRAGEIFGEHQVRLIHTDEELTLTHRAFNRYAFAYGAIKAMYWLSMQRIPGLYHMHHLFNERHDL